MMSILSSLIVYEKRYGYLNEPRDSENLKYSPEHSTGCLVFQNLKYGLKDIFQDLLFLHLKLNNFDYCELVLWNSAILLLEEVLSDHNCKILQHELLMMLLENVSFRNVKISKASADGLSILAENYQSTNLDDETVILIIDRIVWGISEHLTVDDKTQRIKGDLHATASIVSRLYRCLLEWLMVVPSNIFTNPNISLRLSEVIDETVHVASVGIEKEKEEDNHFYFLLKVTIINEESAENTLVHLNHHIENYSPLYGPAMINSTIATPELKSHYLSFNKHTIISFTELPDESKVRVLVRNAAGRFTWDMAQFHHSLEAHDCQSKAQRKQQTYINTDGL